MSIRCLIVDDEPVARQVLRQYVEDAPGLVLSGECKDALDAIGYLNKNSVDLLFLDINMPRLSGLSFLKSLTDPPLVILTTAYSEFALEGYELDVVDYLLKPFSFERFLKAVNKATSKLSGSENGMKDLVVKADGQLHRVAKADILFIESMGDYLTLHTPSKKLTFNRTLKSFKEELSGSQFIQVHKSFIVALSKINYIEGNMIYLEGHEIPIGNTFKEDFLKKYQT